MLKISYKQGIVLFLIIFVLGISLRSYHFSQDLIFQSDQSRDALIVNQAVEEGFGSIPLIGPQARGSALHLGPISYYFQYVSGLLFGSKPEVFAYPDLFFGVMTLPLLCLLLMRLVSRDIALMITALASVSLLLVTFSRFAWNPNSLPFFTTALALLFVDLLHKTGSRWWRLIGIALCIGIIVQLHFVAAISLLLSFLVFLFIYRPLIWKEIAIVFFVVFTLQAPTFMYEIQNKGAVSEALIETIDEKGNQDNKHSLLEKAFRSYQEQARIIWLSVTGYQNTESILTRGITVKCDKQCKSRLPATLASLMLTTFLLWLGYRRWKEELNEQNKQTFAFFGIWFISFFFVTTLVAYQISTRFYLAITPLLFIFLALLFEWLRGHFPFKKYRHYFIGLVFLVLFIVNIQATKTYLEELSSAAVMNTETNKDLVFGTEQKVTLEQLRLMAIETDRVFAGSSPIFVSGESRYTRSLFYLLTVERGREACYRKGSVDGFVFQDHVTVLKNKNQEGVTAFGTMAIMLKRAESNQRDIELPLDCFRY